MVASFLPISVWSTARTAGGTLREVIHKVASTPSGLRLILEDGVRDPGMKHALPFGCELFPDDMEDHAMLRKIFDESIDGGNFIAIHRLTCDAIVTLFPLLGRDEHSTSTSIKTTAEADAVMQKKCESFKLLIEAPELSAQWSLFRWALRCATVTHNFTSVDIHWPSASSPGGSNEVQVLLWESKS